MCTAFSIDTKEHYFGRNLDLDRSYGEEVCVMPRFYPLSCRKMGKLDEHYAIIGMATVVDGIPLFYDGANEYGLSMAGLNFPGNAYYPKYHERKDNITPFEFIPWILGQCKTVAEAEILLEGINLVDIPFSDKLPLSPLHWIIDDKKRSVVVESRRDGVFVHQNPVNVLTNNPPFEYQLENLKKYGDLRADNREVIREDNLPYVSYCQGLGAVGLPGDVSSVSRFARAVFGIKYSMCDGDEISSVSQVFHLLSLVEMVKGVCITDGGIPDITVYSACINADRGLYYYTTYDNRQITCVDMHNADMNGKEISRFPLILKQNIMYQK